MHTSTEHSEVSFTAAEFVVPSLNTVSADARPIQNLCCDPTSQISIITVSSTGGGGGSSSSSNTANLILTFQCVRWSYQKISCANRLFPRPIFSKCQHPGTDIIHIHIYINKHTEDKASTNKQNTQIKFLSPQSSCQRSVPPWTAHIIHRMFCYRLM